VADFRIIVAVKKKKEMVSELCENKKRIYVGHKEFFWERGIHACASSHLAMVY
jgi:hypothetical protein